MNQLKTCPCGHDKNHKMVIKETKYTALGMFLILIGISAKPKKIKYQCIQCQLYFDEENK